MEFLERAISAEERIRRAEEIYQRRKMQGGVRVSTSSVNSTSNKEYRLFKKLALQIAICLLLYFIFYLINNSNYIFSESVINKTKEFLSYDINFENLFNQIGNYYNDHIAVLLKNNENEEEDKKEGEEKEEVNQKEEIENENVENADKQNVVNENAEDNAQENKKEEVDAVGGGEEGENLLANEIANEEINKQPIQELSQMEIDANEIKSNYSFIIPLKGVISSRFRTKNSNSHSFW